MVVPDAKRQFATLDKKMSPEDYNFEHFRTKHYLLDGQGTLTGRGIKPGEMAPDFEAPRVDGGTLRLSELRGRPVLLHFGSIT